MTATPEQRTLVAEALRVSVPYLTPDRLRRDAYMAVAEDLEAMNKPRDWFIQDPFKIGDRVRLKDPSSAEIGYVHAVAPQGSVQISWIVGGKPSNPGHRWYAPDQLEHAPADQPVAEPVKAPMRSSDYADAARYWYDQAVHIHNLGGLPASSHCAAMSSAASNLAMLTEDDWDGKPVIEPVPGYVPRDERPAPRYVPADLNDSTSPVWALDDADWGEIALALDESPTFTDEQKADLMSTRAKVAAIIADRSDDANFVRSIG